ncbi:hypothetical protein NWT09_14110 [Mycolicibacterium sp. jd]|uniref:hypothetical protein n=1 Tax=unclassified Mycolicibacterium TaxID=2636767 RepID=UPI00351B2E2C
MESDKLGALAAAFDVYAAALSDEQFNELVARTRTPKSDTAVDGNKALARGREAFKVGGHNRLTTTDVEPTPGTDYTINS